RVALRPVYPEIAAFHLNDYKVHILDQESATAAKVRVLIETTEPQGSWITVGVSPNIIEASWHALIDSIVVGLLRPGVEPITVAGRSVGVAGATEAR
ncbi:MAG: alpha-isopropylmalate synthase regulatory domain-containing protein, partial [Actinomycetota bacterium]